MSSIVDTIPWVVRPLTCLNRQNCQIGALAILHYILCSNELNPSVGLCGMETLVC